MSFFFFDYQWVDKSHKRQQMWDISGMLDIFTQFVSYTASLFTFRIPYDGLSI